MKALLLGALVSATLSFGGAAAAADRIVAQLEQPVAAKTKLVVGGSVWSCEGSTCTAVQQTSRATSLRACQSLAKEVGRLTTFGAARAYEAEQLTRCNTAAATPAPTFTETAAAN